MRLVFAHHGALPVFGYVFLELFARKFKVALVAAITRHPGLRELFGVEFQKIVQDVRALGFGQNLFEGRITERIYAVRESDNRLAAFDSLENFINSQFQRVVKRGARARFQKPERLLDLRAVGGQVSQQFDLLAELNDGDAISRAKLVEEPERGSTHQIDLIARAARRVEQ